MIENKNSQESVKEIKCKIEKKKNVLKKKK